MRLTNTKSVPKFLAMKTCLPLPKHSLKDLYPNRKPKPIQYWDLFKQNTGVILN